MYAYLNADFGLFLHDTISRPTDFVAPMRLSSNTDIFGQYAPQGRLAGLIDDLAFRTFALEWSCDVYMPESIYAGDGADALKYNPVSDSSFPDYDRIMDPGADDFIDLRNLDANVNVAGDQSFTQVDELTGEAGQVTLTWLPDGFTLLAADIDGDGVADMRIVMNGDFDDFLGLGG
ncbi:hypothetical protein IWC96_08630 [Brevundimonas sp. BAL450]|jgi:hypothetical protein|uniref:M10 family metallopeptidase C-terminal domain-containing protein n=1 Tax=Brevundimonas sp. BAL450 TaxID=1708162 RepID=UPI0018CB9608|nr:hypothetical protein [Brevundimonas sp. BAL450]MBG7615346.1 hypothetical protein [Brevundimonas sp. BAL450]